MKVNVLISGAKGKVCTELELDDCCVLERIDIIWEKAIAAYREVATDSNESLFQYSIHEGEKVEE